MTDMIERLRAPYYWMSGGNCDNEEEDHTPFEAANEIERLRNRVAYLEFVSRTVQGEQIKLAADLMQEKIVSDRLRAALAPLVELAGAIRDDAEKATPGPWRVVLYDAGDVEYRDQNGPCPSIQAPETEDCGVVHWEGFKQRYWTSANGNQKQITANARLICALRNDALAAILAAADAISGDNK